LRIRLLRGRAALTARGTSSTFFALLGVAVLAAAVGTSLPAEAQKRKPAKPAEVTLPDPADGEPMTLVVSLGQQKVDVYRGLTLVTTSSVSTGQRGYATKAGVFSILEKQRMHHSNLYSGAPMPWMNRITWSGTALHAGVVPGYPASHGCIRLPFSFAPRLYKITTVGDNVIVTRDRPAPQVIEHPNLFQPLPPSAPSMVKEEEAPKRQTQNEIVPAATAHPRMLARADMSNSATDVPSVEAEAVRERGATPPKTDPAAVEDTHAHAFDPRADAPAEISHDKRSRDHAGKSTSHALDEEGAPEASFAKDEPAPARAIERAATTETPAVAPTPVRHTDPAPASAPSPAVTVTLESKPAEAAAPSPVLPAEVPAAAAELKPADASASAANVPPPASAEAKPAPAEQALVALASPVAASPLQPLGTPSSDAAAKLMAGTKEMALLAAEPRSTAPLRILVTRRTQRDRVIGVQQIFADMGYLERLEFDGTLGKPTVVAIKKFQAANGMPETGAMNEELIKKVYEVAGKGEPPAGHVYVRQEFGRVFDAPVSFKDPETPLGTHLFTAMKFAPGDTSTRWIGMSLMGDSSAAVLDRLEIPNDVRQKISERLTPGSSLIIGDTAINTAGLTKGNDFVVWAKETPAKIIAASADGDFSPPKRKKKKIVRRPYLDYGYSTQRTPGFTRGSGWPW
jgi:peptidoglycan hydrolase-like protein with peptidoglycan-binding domain